MKKEPAKFYAVNTLTGEETEIEADHVVMKAPDGQVFQLSFCRYSGEISISSPRSAISIEPRVANIVNIKCIN